MNSQQDTLAIIYYNNGIFFAPKIIIEVLGFNSRQELSLDQVDECIRSWRYLPTAKRLSNELIDRCNKHAIYIETRLARLRLVRHVRR